MKLYWSSRSPFVRKVMVCAHEAGLAGRINCERTIVSAAQPNLEVMAANPLGKLPTLILDDGSALYDSRVICEYFDTLQDRIRLFPAGGDVRITALRRQALADGLLDTLVAWMGERTRPPEQQSAAHLDGYRLKLRAALECLEAEAEKLGTGGFDIGHIAIGTALSYTDFRFPAEHWRDGHPGLARWHATFALRDSVTATEHADVY